MNSVPVADSTVPDVVRVRGARVNNLRDVDVDIPLNKLVSIAWCEWLRDAYATAARTPGKVESEDPASSAFDLAERNATPVTERLPPGAPSTIAAGADE